jgi:hypothetical protein
MTFLLLQHWNFISGWANFYRITFYYGEITSNFDENISVNEYGLLQNYPNPFNPSTKITYSIPERGNVTLKVFDLLGGEIAELVNGEIEAGSYEINFDASSMTSGVYFYRIQARGFVQTRKMILLK